MAVDRPYCSKITLLREYIAVNLEKSRKGLFFVYSVTIYHVFVILCTVVLTFFVVNDIFWKIKYFEILSVIT